MRSPRNAPAAERRPGSITEECYLVEGAGVVDFFFLLCFLLVDFPLLVDGVEEEAGAPAAGVSAAIGAADFGISAAIAAAAMPKLNKAEVIRVPDLVMGSPAVI
jgi:hypothetical protein